MIRALSAKQLFREFDPHPRLQPNASEDYTINEEDMEFESPSWAPYARVAQWLSA